MTALTIVRAAALGAAAMYLLDPDRGRRRRAVARDKARSAITQGGEFLQAARSDAQARWQGARALARRLRRDERIPDDRVLTERVRARLGRVVAHPHAVQVTAERGHVRLGGPILKWEHTPLMVAVRLVRGVQSVDDSGLVLHDSAEGVPSLQGTGRRPGFQVIDESWTPAVRLFAITGGGALALYGLACGGLARLAFSGAGLALVARGGFNMPLRDLARGGPEDVRGTRRLHGAARPGGTREATGSVAQAAGEGMPSEGATGGATGSAGRSARPNGSASNQYVQQGNGPMQQSAGGSSQTQLAQGSAGRGAAASSQQSAGSSAPGMQQSAGNAMSPQPPGMTTIPQSQQQQALSGGRPMGEPGAGAQYACPDTAHEQMAAWARRPGGQS